MWEQLGTFTATRAPKSTPQQLEHVLVSCVHMGFDQNISGMSADWLMTARKFDGAKYKEVSAETNENQCKVYVCKS